MVHKSNQAAAKSPSSLNNFKIFSMLFIFYFPSFSSFFWVSPVSWLQVLPFLSLTLHGAHRASLPAYDGCCWEKTAFPVQTLDHRGQSINWNQMLFVSGWNESERVRIVFVRVNVKTWNCSQSLLYCGHTHAASCLTQFPWNGKLVENQRWHPLPLTFSVFSC